MSRLQSIENALISINPAAFQELCDSFLALRNPNFITFSRTGSKSGKQKTIKGTPDSFLMLPNGKFIFIEYSTNVSAGYSKLVKDIEKCLDPEKVRIPSSQISEIIICINFNLDAEEVYHLKSLLSDTRIMLTIYNLDYLAIEIHLNHRDLAHSYLGLALDTGQIVSLESFIQEYNKSSKGIATPLDNKFLHREKEVIDLLNTMKTSDFIILTGSPGIGKTKLALETIKLFLKENLSYNAYCVSYKSHTLLDDLYQYLASNKNYVLFVDDANRIDAFQQIIGFYTQNRAGNLKIILTVRDYALNNVRLLIQQLSYQRIDLKKLSDDQIIDIIKAEPFGFNHQEGQGMIKRISDGNPRIAIMMAQLAISKQNIYALANVSELFESYFSTFIQDSGKLSNQINIKCLGLVAFFYTIPYKDKELTDSILNKFGIRYEEFVDSMDTLEKLELVEIQFDHVKIPEQNLATFFFFKVFIKDRLLSIDTLLLEFFPTNQAQFQDCIIPAYSNFGYQAVVNVLEGSLKKYWGIIKNDEDAAFNLLNVFWIFLKIEAFDFLYNTISKIKDSDNSEYIVIHEQRSYHRDSNRIIRLISFLFMTPETLKEALELGFEYVRKIPSELNSLLRKIEELIAFDTPDYSDNFKRQEILFNIISLGLKNNLKFYSVVFFDLSSSFLSFLYRHHRSDRRMTVTFYEFPIPNSQAIQNIRTTIWNDLDGLFQFSKKSALNVLTHYSNFRVEKNVEVMRFDLPFIVNIINSHLSPTSFEDCLYVHEQIYCFKRHSIEDETLLPLSRKFTNYKYEVYIKLNWDRIKDKNNFDFKSYKDYDALKEKQIRSEFLFETEYDVEKFYKIFSDIVANHENLWSFPQSLDHILDENLLSRFPLGLKLMKEILRNKNIINFVPRLAFANNLKDVTKANQIWETIQEFGFQHKSLWELSFYTYGDLSTIVNNPSVSIENTFIKIDQPTYINLELLSKYLISDPGLLNQILFIILQKNKDKHVRLQLWEDSLINHFDEIKNDFELLCATYLQQDKLQQSFDYDGKLFVKILKISPDFLLRYIRLAFPEGELSHSDLHKNLSIVWEVDDIETTLEQVFSYSIENRHYFGVLEHFGNVFFRNLDNSFKFKAANFLLHYCDKNYTDSDKMNIIIDIARHSQKDLFETLLLRHIHLSQDPKLFSQIYWRGSGVSGSGDTILADIEAADWRNILSIINRSDLGSTLIPIKRYVNDRIDSCLTQGNYERKRRFLDRY